jgi:hypothetical protein
LSALPLMMGGAHAADELARDACRALAANPQTLTIDPGAGGDTLVLTGRRSRDEPPSGETRIIEVTDPESPRSLASHDRLILPGRPSDWVAVARGVDLLLCQRHAARAVVIVRHFCSGPLSIVDVPNGEIEEITFIGGTTWLADDILALAYGTRMPPELEERIRADLAEETEKGNIAVQDVEAVIARWRVVPLSQGLGRPVIDEAESCAM